MWHCRLGEDLGIVFTKAVVTLGSEAGSCSSCRCVSLSSPATWQEAEFVIPLLANKSGNEWRNVWGVGIGYSGQKKPVCFGTGSVKLDFVKL